MACKLSYYSVLMYLLCYIAHTLLNTFSYYSLHYTYSSYTTFKYSDLSITPTTIHGGDNVTVTAMVTNAGQMDGDEVGRN